MKFVRFAVLSFLITSITYYSAFGAGPGKGDVVVEWQKGSPAKVGADLVLKAKVTFKNGWAASGQAVFTVFPVKGGQAKIVTVNIDAQGNFETTIPLQAFPNPGVDHTLVPSVNAQKNGAGELFPIVGPSENLVLQ